MNIIIRSSVASYFLKSFGNDIVLKSIIHTWTNRTIHLYEVIIAIIVIDGRVLTLLTKVYGRIR